MGEGSAALVGVCGVWGRTMSRNEAFLPVELLFMVSSLKTKIFILLILKCISNNAAKPQLYWRGQRKSAEPLWSLQGSSGNVK